MVDRALHGENDCHFSLFHLFKRWTVFCKANEGEQLHQYDGSVSEEVWESSDCGSLHYSSHNRSCLDSCITECLGYMWNYTQPNNDPFRPFSQS